MLALGTEAPRFALPDPDGRVVSLDDFGDARALLIEVICNHCPYVIHVREELVRLANDYRPRGVAVVAINPNDAEAYPDDGPERMREVAKRYGYPFPYLIDETQAVTKSLRAACTPDFFLFDAARKLVYRGQLDGSRPGNTIPVTGGDLRRALDTLLAGERPSVDQRPSIGCSVKWKPGNTPDYLTA
jgi:peroxiredoxin